MFHIPYLYMIHQCIYTLHTLMHALSRFELKTTWRCTKVFTTKPLQNFDKIKRKFNFIIFNIKIFLKFKL